MPGETSSENGGCSAPGAHTYVCDAIDCWLYTEIYRKPRLAFSLFQVSDRSAQNATPAAQSYAGVKSAFIVPCSTGILLSFYPVHSMPVQAAYLPGDFSSYKWLGVLLALHDDSWS